MPVPKLFALAQRVCIKNVRSIVDIGDAPYSLMRPILLKVETAEQLHEIEKVSPQIIGEDAELWLNLIKRDVERWEDYFVEPKNPASWFKVYRKLIKEAKERIEEDALAMKAAMDGLHKQVLERQTVMVSAKSLPKLPKMGGMRGEVKKGGPIRTANTSALTFSSGSKTKTTSAQGVLDRARREAREMGHVIKKSTLTTPTHLLAHKAKPINALPKGMVESHKRAELAKRPTTPPSKPPAGRPATIASAMSLEERERRRQAIKEREKKREAIEARQKSKPVITSSASTTPESLTPEEDAKAGLPKKYRAGKLRRLSPVSRTTPIDVDKNHIEELCMMPGAAGRAARIAERKAERLAKLSPDSKPSVSPVKPPPKIVRKAPADPFMPSKKRRIA